VECKRGASWVQKEILEEHPDSDVKVYVVWFNMLSLVSWLPAYRTHA
jgi:hypothetical protein